MGLQRLHRDGRSNPKNDEGRFSIFVSKKKLEKNKLEVISFFDKCGSYNYCMSMGSPAQFYIVTYYIE